MFITHSCLCHIKGLLIKTTSLMEERVQMKKPKLFIYNSFAIVSFCKIVCTYHKLNVKSIRSQLFQGGSKRKSIGWIRTIYTHLISELTLKCFVIDTYLFTLGWMSEVVCHVCQGIQQTAKIVTTITSIFITWKTIFEVV